MSDDISTTRYLEEIGRYPLLSSEQEIDLSRRIHSGDKTALETMIQSNLRLVVKIANDYLYAGIDLMDLVSEGNIGLCRAAERFDGSKGVKFSTYAAWHIKSLIRRAIHNQSRTIRLPVHAGDKCYAIYRATRKLEEALGHEPSLEEVAREAGLSPKQLQMLKEINQRPASLDAPMGEESGNSFGSIIEDENSLDPYFSLEQKDRHCALLRLMGTLPEREQEILYDRFGFAGNGSLTLEQIGVRHNVTRERIRQIEVKALELLKTKINNIERVA